MIQEEMHEYDCITKVLDETDQNNVFYKNRNKETMISFKKHRIVIALMEDIYNKDISIDEFNIVLYCIVLI